MDFALPTRHYLLWSSGSLHMGVDDVVDDDDDWWKMRFWGRGRIRAPATAVTSTSPESTIRCVGGVHRERVWGKG